MSARGYSHVTTVPNDRKNQHSVPESYLADWCDPATPSGAYFWASPKDRSGPSKRMPPRRAFTVSEMNTLIKGDERNLALEAFYGQIETEFGKVKDKIISGAEPVQSDIEAVVCFVAAQMVRTPKFRAGWSLAPASGHEAQLDAITDSDLRAAIEGTTANLVKNGQKIFTFLALPRAIKLLGEFRVTLLKTDDEVGFVTSDSPCCVIQYAHQPDQVRRGLHSPTVNVMMSLSRSVVAIFDRSPSEHQMIRLFPDHPIAIEINALLWRGADKWVVLPRCKTARAEWFHEAVRTKLTQYTVA